jgi:hypothetical protein
MKDQPPIFLTDTKIHSDTQAEPRKLSSLTLQYKANDVRVLHNKISRKGNANRYS